MKSTTIVVAALLVLSGCQSLKYPADYKSANPQVRCDAFYKLFGSSLDYEHNRELRKLRGLTTTQIHELLGEPSDVGTLNYRGVKWLGVFYRFDECPSEAPGHWRESWKQGWRYGPWLLFRDGVVVPQQVMDDELHTHLYQITPEHLRLKSGGVFP